MMRINVKRNGFVLTEIAASLLLAACGGSSPTDNGTPSVSDSEVSGVLSETESKALTESLRRKGHLSQMMLTSSRQVDPGTSPG